MPNTLPTIVLVHGALTDASVWHPVIARLQGRRFRVLAPAMPMRGLASDAAYLRRFLDTIDGPVVCAAHSYGGSIVSHPSALTPMVRALVFVAAFQQDRGEAAGELNMRFPGSLLTPDAMIAREYPGGSEVYLQAERFAEIYASDVDPALAAVMAAAQHPIDPAALGETFDDEPTWRSLPSWTLVSTNDRSIPPGAQRFMAERAGSDVVEVISSHAVPISHPEETVEIIIAASHAVSAGAATPAIPMKGLS